MTTFKKAHELIKDPENWCQGTVQHRWCAIAAIQYVHGNDGYYSNHQKLFNHINGDKLPERCISIPRWNDHNDHETVYNTLKALDI